MNWQSWLVSLYLDCPPDLGIDCPDDDAKKVPDILMIAPFMSEVECVPESFGNNRGIAQAFIDAVQRGDIWWHAMPHNAELEFMDRSMLQANIQLTHELDRSFGLPPKVTMSQVSQD